MYGGLEGPDTRIGKQNQNNTLYQKERLIRETKDSVRRTAMDPWNWLPFTYVRPLSGSYQ